MMKAEDIVSRLGASTAEERAAGYASIDELVAGDTTPEAVATALACVEPLLTILGKPVADIPPAEYRRAVLALESLAWVDHGAVASAYYASDKRGLVFQPSNACYCVGLEVPPVELSREDILTVGYAFKTVYNLATIRGMPPELKLFDCFPWLDNPLATWHPIRQSDSSDTARIDRLVELTLALMHDLNAAPDDVAAGAMVAAGLIQARPAAAVSLVKGGFLDRAVALAKRSSPMEWASASSVGGWHLYSIAIPIGILAQVTQYAF